MIHHHLHMHGPARQMHLVIHSLPIQALKRTELLCQRRP